MRTTSEQIVKEIRALHNQGFALKEILADLKEREEEFGEKVTFERIRVVVREAREACFTPAQNQRINAFLFNQPFGVALP